MATLNFDSTNVPVASAPEIIPAGWYNVVISESGMKPTADGKGSYLNLVLTVIDGPFKNRKLFDRLNINNASKQAKDIAYETLSAICHATGIIQVAESTQLHNIPMSAKVKIVPPEGKYSEKNEITGYKALATAVGASVAAPAWAGNAPAAAAAPAWAAPASPTPAPAATGSSVPPWANQ